MLIVAGWIQVDAEARDEYVASCVGVVEQGRAADGCLDFSLTADTVVPGRINIFERWDSEEQLLAFRGSGQSDEQAAQIRGAEMARYEISAVGPP